jgi:PKD repeat protein
MAPPWACGRIAPSLVPTGPIVLSDNASVAAVADSGTGTAADPFVIENRSFQLNYSDSGIMGLATECYITIRNCFFNASDPSGVAMAFLVQAAGAIWIDNCTVISSGISGFLNAPDGRLTNCIFQNNSGILLDTADNFYAENVTLEDSFIAVLDIDILSHAISHNITFKNVYNFETGTANVTSGTDLILSDVDGALLENITIDCEDAMCATYMFNCTDITLDGFYREAPEVGLYCGNITGLDITRSYFDMDGNASLWVVNCSGVRITNTTFETNGTENVAFQNCTGVEMEGFTIVGGGLNISQVNSTYLHNGSIANAVTGILVGEASGMLIEGVNFTACSYACMAFTDEMTGGPLENVTITGADFDIDATGLDFSELEGIDVLAANSTFHGGIGIFIGDALGNSSFTIEDNLFDNSSVYCTNNANKSIVIEHNLFDGVSFNGSSVLTNETITNNAYWDYFDINTGYGTYYFYEGQILPVEYEVFPSVNDTTPFYSEYLFGPRVNITPAPDFVANTTIVLEGDWVMFNFTGVTGNRPCTFTWDFGDNSSLLGENVSHQYVTPGTYFVCLNVTDSDGQSSLENKTAYIVVGASILADFYIQGFPHQYEAGVKYTAVFDGVASILPSTYAWTFGDGGFSSGTTVSHKYQRAGTFTITLTVTDSLGHSDSHSKTIVIRDDAGPGTEPGPVVVPLSGGWEGLLVGGAVIVGMGVVLIFWQRSRSTRVPARGGKGARRPAPGKGRAGR